MLAIIILLDEACRRHRVLYEYICHCQQCLCLLFRIMRRRLGILGSTVLDCLETGAGIEEREGHGGNHPCYECYVSITLTVNALQLSL